MWTNLVRQMNKHDSSMMATIMTLPVKIILYTYMQVINNELIFFRKFSDPSRFFQYNFFSMVIRLCLKNTLFEIIFYAWMICTDIIVFEELCVCSKFLSDSNPISRKKNEPRLHYYKLKVLQVVFSISMYWKIYS